MRKLKDGFKPPFKITAEIVRVPIAETDVDIVVAGAVRIHDQVGMNPFAINQISKNNSLKE